MRIAGLATSLLLAVEPVWWSITSVVVTFAASISFLLGGLAERREAKAAGDAPER